MCNIPSARQPSNLNPNLPRHLRRPAATPSAAGITPGWQWLCREGEPVTRGQLRRALRQLEHGAVEAIAALTAQVAALQREVADLRRQLGGRDRRG